MLLLSASFVNAQKTSTQYNYEVCPQTLVKRFFEKDSSSFYSLNSFSRAALVETGSLYEITFSIKRGKDYRTSLFLTDIIRDDSLNFEIINSEGLSLYKNNDLLSSFEFVSYIDQDLFLKVNIPGDNYNKEISPGIIKKTSETGCLVVLFEETISPKFGF